MELTTTLEGQRVENRVRAIGINPNHWYAVARSEDLKPGCTLPVTVWQQAIALFRDTTGTVRALEDACPHKGIALHKGDVCGTRLVCPYHGWEFEGDTGRCARIPYLPATQKLPPACARSFPVREQYGAVWLFPGDPELARDRALPVMTEFGNDEWLCVPLAAKFAAHFSMCNENTMDVFHGYLHRGLQGWFDPRLSSLHATDDTIRATYDVSYRGRLATWLGLSDRADRVTTLPVSIEYRYPHYETHLEGVSALYLFRLPVHPTESHSFAYFFFRVPLPRWLLRGLRSPLRVLLRRFILRRFLAQDIEMVENEQRTYLTNPQRRYVEINPAIIALQRLLVRQYCQYERDRHEDRGKVDAAGTCQDDTSLDSSPRRDRSTV
ncbi:phenylpropionate dioxygenase [Rubidibacter lacunae KORDI 51-2]|uniref:Phenylpropionate dioxygenase n=1 Tax=Rubidibacter lacunae KORDI 51-2 TaxID=582515 RepID=U5DND7_9CHRO|nr:aromatic ring-hydroxylating dioxygenase subunit alpha [Rubidibacter lacunae]ERN43176.1 phenylpropionate dioxygenase [Rubidibacter lacunae KORDI 51-2]